MSRRKPIQESPDDSYEEFAEIHCGTPKCKGQVITGKTGDKCQSCWEYYCERCCSEGFWDDCGEFMYCPTCLPGQDLEDLKEYNQKWWEERKTKKREGSLATEDARLEELIKMLKKLKDKMRDELDICEPKEEKKEQHVATAVVAKRTKEEEAALDKWWGEEKRKLAEENKEEYGDEASAMYKWLEGIDRKIEKKGRERKVAVNKWREEQKRKREEEKEEEGEVAKKPKLALAVEEPPYTILSKEKLLQDDVPRPVRLPDVYVSKEGILERNRAQTRRRLICFDPQTIGTRHEPDGKKDHFCRVCGGFIGEEEEEEEFATNKRKREEEEDEKKDESNVGIIGHARVQTQRILICSDPDIVTEHEPEGEKDAFCGICGGFIKEVLK